jgi:N-acyl-D-amino-acid deacylase
MMFELLIQHGEVVDGSGAPRYRADVAVAGGRIAALGSLPDAEAETTLDATGCVVTPGFVDMHSHADFSLPIRPTADSLVRQGITTVVVGQCGSSPAPLLPETRDQVIAMHRSEDRPLPWEAWSTFGSYLAHLAELGTSLNVVPLVGLGMIRAAVMGFTARPATPAEIGRMQAHVEQAMDEGAIGVSTGLIYPPGSYTSTEELIAVSRPAGERDGFYFSHIRGESDTLLASVAEAIRIGRETGAAVQISHFKAVGQPNWAKSAAALALIDQARAESLDVSADLYPYLASSTGLSATLPAWAHEGGKDALLSRLRDPKVRRQMAREMQAGGAPRAGNWDAILISNAPQNRAYEGHTVAELAAGAGTSPSDWVFDALLETELDIGMIKFGMSEENRQRELRHPALMIGTDGAGLAPEGPLSEGKPHPRSYGTFPRVLGHYVREAGVLSLEEAVWKMCGLPAQKLRWIDRGRVEQGLHADLVVLDPQTVADRATYTQPHQFPAGVHHVVVNGRLVVRDGVHVGARPGSILGW